MKQTNTAGPLLVSMLPRMSRMLYFGKDSVIADNIDQKMPPSIEEAINAGRPTRMASPPNLVFPRKLMFNSMIFVTAGFVRCEVNLQPFVIEAPALFMAPNGTIIDKLCYPVGTRSLIIAFNDTDRFGAINNSSSKIIRLHTASPRIIPFQKDRMDRYTQLFRIILHVQESPEHQFKDDILRGFMEVLLGSIAKILLEEEAKKDLAAISTPAIDTFVSLVQKHCQQERSLSFYAEKMHMSPKYLSGLIASSGRNASQIIRDNLILEAKVLLRSGQYNVQEVSNILGFPNASFFGRYFKNATGITPRKYQKEN